MSESTIFQHSLGN